MWTAGEPPVGCDEEAAAGGAAVRREGVPGVEGDREEDMESG